MNGLFTLTAGTCYLYKHRLCLSGEDTLHTDSIEMQYLPCRGLSGSQSRWTGQVLDSSNAQNQMMSITQTEITTMFFFSFGTRTWWDCILVCEAFCSMIFAVLFYPLIAVIEQGGTSSQLHEISFQHAPQWSDLQKCPLLFVMELSQQCRWRALCM